MSRARKADGSRTPPHHPYEEDVPFLMPRTGRMAPRKEPLEDDDLDEIDADEDLDEDEDDEDLDAEFEEDELDFDPETEPVRTPTRPR